MDARIQQLVEEINRRKAHLAAIHSMISTDGWKLFQAAFVGSKEAAFAKAVNADDPYVACKHMAAYKQLQDITTWTDREITACEDLIRQLSAELSRFTRHR